MMRQSGSSSRRQGRRIVVDAVHETATEDHLAVAIRSACLTRREAQWGQDRIKDGVDAFESGIAGAGMRAGGHDLILAPAGCASVRQECPGLQRIDPYVRINLIAHAGGDRLRPSSSIPNGHDEVVGRHPKQIIRLGGG